VGFVRALHKNESKQEKPRVNTMPAAIQPPSGSLACGNNGRHTILLSRRRREASTRAAAVPNTETSRPTGAIPGRRNRPSGCAAPDRRSIRSKGEDGGRAGQDSALAAVRLDASKRWCGSPGTRRLGNGQFTKSGGERGEFIQFGGTAAHWHACSRTRRSSIASSRPAALRASNWRTDW